MKVYVCFRHYGSTETSEPIKVYQYESEAIAWVDGGDTYGENQYKEMEVE